MGNGLYVMLGVLGATGFVRADALTEVVVVAGQLRPQELATVPVSVTVLGENAIDAMAVQHFQELVPLIPNLNWSGEGSRARYFQIRGTGELEQYEGAPNPSVGFILDDIDVSGIGGVATSFDVHRIEVLRGPQGTRYGANALAGLILVEAGQPQAEAGGKVQATLGEDQTRALGGVAYGPVAGFGEALTWRVAVQQYASDGFRDNAYLGRSDTSGRDELTARVKLRWQPGPDLSVQLTGFHVNLQNGYDDFNLAGGFTTYADQPGQDAQQTDAVALRATLGLGTLAELVSITGFASSRIVYSFDADWGNPDFFAPLAYAFSQSSTRDRDTVNQEIRLVSQPDSHFLGADWLVGLYGLKLTEAITQQDRGNCDLAACGAELVFDTTRGSHYEATNLAAYGELGWSLPAGTRLTAGVRREVRRATYQDTAGGSTAPVDHLLGGDLTVSHTWGSRGVGETEAATLWARVARGYKAGGFNPSLLGLPEAEDRVGYAPEYLWNYEVGTRLIRKDGRGWLQGSLFLQDRTGEQLKIPQQFRVGDPTTFVFFTANGEQGRATGLELEAAWQPGGGLAFGAALGLLRTEIRQFSSRPELEGRELAHAPRYTVALNGTWRGGAGWFARVDFTGKGDYSIDYCQALDCNDPRTGSFQQLDLRAGRAWGAWSVEVWCRNALDEFYATRGFFFGNEPPQFTPTLYTRLGDPRQAGVSLEYGWSGPVPR